MVNIYRVWAGVSRDFHMYVWKERTAQPGDACEDTSILWRGAFVGETTGGLANVLIPVNIRDLFWFDVKGQQAIDWYLTLMEIIANGQKNIMEV